MHKHISLLQLIKALQKKTKGFLYLDTHAGEGLHDLAGAEARLSNEGEAGISLLERSLAQHTGASHPAIGDYIDTIDRIRRDHGNKRSLYPGSPLLAATQLRAVDQSICVESHAQTSRALQRMLEHSANLIASMPRVVQGDGYQQIRAQLPPTLRRGLILIDPPYEAADEEQQIADALLQGLTRFETGVFAVWYPIKKQYDTDLWLTRVLRGITRPTVAIELCVHQPDHTAGLNGSGLMVVNPPWQFDTEAAAWQAELHALFGGTSGSLVKWLINE
ncbi:MAG: 23S rRNA (adenine(2030)-N(6))-methyltransferase RlmJ [Steroidobacteraceae bacterium]